MITEWLIGIGVIVMEWVVGLLPDWDAPAAFVNFDSQINGFFAQFDGLGVWAPWALIGVCIAVALSVWGIGFVIKLLRAIASYIPFFGGAG